ncbi:hypothetical protein ABG768_003544 [Culter alburnus]|uniref:Uncharacterized protein n=1 Tax=Culter alburnus TaxID=194366 RepID=A0AAW2A1A3_CULAL
MINITKAPLHFHTVEQKSWIHLPVSPALSCVFYRRSPSRAGSGRCLCESGAGKPSGELRKREERREATVHTLRCSAGWRRKRRCLYWSYSRGWTVSSPMLVSGLFTSEDDGDV